MKIDFRPLVGSLLLLVVASTVTSTSAFNQFSWDDAQAVDFRDGVQDAFEDSVVNEIDCPADGSCVAVGYFYAASGGNEAYTIASTSGTWSQASPVTFAPSTQNTAPEADLLSVSCASVSTCVAVGFFKDVAGKTVGLLTSFLSGAWGQAEPISFASSVVTITEFVNDVSCPSPSSCVAVGQHMTTGGRDSFTVQYNAGSWSDANPVGFNGGLQDATTNSNLRTVACGSVGDCVAGGYFTNADGDQEPFTVRSNSGTWFQAEPATFAIGIRNSAPSDSFITSSCSSSNWCALGGYFIDTLGQAIGLLMTPPSSTLTTTTTTAVRSTTTTTVQTSSTAPTTTIEELPATGRGSTTTNLKIAWLLIAIGCLSYFAQQQRRYHS